MNFSYIFDGTRSVSPESFDWFPVPKFEAEGVRMDTISLPSNIVPLFPLLQKSEKEIVFQACVEEPGAQCIDFVFSMDTTMRLDKPIAQAEMEFNEKVIGASAAIKNYILGLSILEKGYHITERSFKQNKMRGAVILIRVYRDSDFECVEHPEMLLGAPLGQHHCAVCGELMLAGLPHFTREEIETEYKAES